MRNKILNTSLITILLILLLFVIKKEIANKWTEKYNWSCYVNVAKEDAPVRISNGEFSGNDVYVDFPVNENVKGIVFNSCSNKYDNHGEKAENKLPPDSLAIDWFSYAENQFYKSKSKLPYNKIQQQIKAHKFRSFDFILQMKKEGLVDLYLKDTLRNSKDSVLVIQIRGQKYDKKWEYGNDRDYDVKVMLLGLEEDK